ncbi:MAG: alpha amylase N-terminal ig-like domain-containing protein [Spirochaetes bacterium]|nr:alpha amylase N-terminal ig-like domain-containing protein [Spirochaetota bacterium]
MTNKISPALIIILLMIFPLAAQAVEVEFTYKGKANRVTLAGDFNNWNKDANPMEKQDGGWHLKLDLQPGKWKYKFVIDGSKWIADPKASQFDNDGFGGKNSVILVTSSMKKEDKPPFQYVNLTGDFNNWDQADKAGFMEYKGSGTYQITRLFYPGTFRFKFNMDRSWKVNFGKGQTEGSIKENGDDIKFFVDSVGFYRITLYLDAKKYKVEKADPLQCVAFVEFKKIAYVGDGMILDGSKSLVRQGKQARFNWKEERKNPRSIINNKNRHQEKIETKWDKPGIYRLVLDINDGLKGRSYRFDVRVKDRYSLVGDLTSEDRTDPKTFLDFQEDGLFHKILRSQHTGEFAFRIYKNFKFNVTDAFKLKLKKGKFYLFTFDERTEQFSFAKKNFARFFFDPRKDSRVSGQINSVAVAGSFNSWNSEINKLEKQDDDTYLLFLPLEEGLYYYKLVVNGNQWLYDNNSDAGLKINDGFGGFNSGLFVGDRAEDFGQALSGRINWEAVEHEPEEMKYLNVLGKNLVQIKLRALGGDVDKVRLILYSKDKVTFVNLDNRMKQFGFEYFYNIFSLPQTAVIQYYFEFEKNGKKYFYAKNYRGEDKPSKETFFQAGLGIKFPTPDWVKGVIWYQIMVDRFRNGDKKNDPACTIPWTWSWFKKYRRCEKWDDSKFNDKRYGFYGWDGVWGRLYGGDIQGLIEKLDYLKELGVGAIYLNPVFESASHHKYDTIDYRHIDDDFGFAGENKRLKESSSPRTWKWTKTDKLFLTFIKKAHSKGLKVIIDGVFNHCGDRFWAFEDVKNKKQRSPFKDWFVVTSWEPFQYEGWAGFGGLPIYKEDNNGLVSGIREHIFEITRRWMDPDRNGDPSDGIDGWRLDVPNEVNPHFWEKWRELVKSINPDAYITGEIWDNASFWLKGKHFDAVMNYEWTKIVYRFFIDRSKKYKIDVREFDQSLKDLLASYPMQVNFVMQNLLDSHDTDRILSGIKNPDRYFDDKNRLQDSGPNYDNSKPVERDISIYKLIQIFQFTFLGSPMIYYGTEVGMWGSDDPNNRKPMWWKEMMPYDNPQDVINDEIYEHTRKLARMRNEHSALKTGMFSSFLIDDQDQIYGFLRSDSKEKIFVILNNSDRKQIKELKIETDKKQLTDLLTGKTYPVKDKEIEIELKSKYGVILF